MSDNLTSTTQSNIANELNISNKDNMICERQIVHHKMTQEQIAKELIDIKDGEDRSSKRKICVLQESLAKDLNIGLVPVIIKEELLDEKEKLKKLLATNFGRLKNDPIKQGRVFKEYEELCGVYHGNHIKKEKRQFVVSQEQIAKELGVDVRTLQRLKKLNSLSPDLQELISDGTVKYTTALNVWGKLTNEDQSKLIEELGKDKIKEMKAKESIK